MTPPAHGSRASRLTLTPDAERGEVLRLIRSTIATYLDGRTPAPLPGTGAFARRAGAFVTIHVDGDLRGCIGHPEADEPLATVLSRCAIAASSRDPRFPALTVEDLARARIEVSLLGPIEAVIDAEEIEVGRHGLIVEQDRWQGLLLPQVAIEHRWDRHTFLAQTCLKAGLGPDAWRTGARLFKFEAEVFGEEEGDPRAPASR